MENAFLGLARRKRANEKIRLVVVVGGWLVMRLPHSAPSSLRVIIISNIAISTNNIVVAHISLSLLLLTATFSISISFWMQSNTNIHTHTFLSLMEGIRRKEEEAVHCSWVCLFVSSEFPVPWKVPKHKYSYTAKHSFLRFHNEIHWNEDDGVFVSAFHSASGSLTHIYICRHTSSSITLEKQPLNWQSGESRTFVSLRSVAEPTPQPPVYFQPIHCNSTNKRTPVVSSTPHKLTHIYFNGIQMYWDGFPRLAFGMCMRVIPFKCAVIFHAYSWDFSSALESFLHMQAKTKFNIPTNHRLLVVN